MPASTRTPEPPCPPSVLELVERFALHRETYRQATYNETQVRREFIDPLLKALGWDIDNEHGHAEAYKDVRQRRNDDLTQSRKAAKRGRGMRPCALA
jgi:hypothetical protein